jgi:hypothetical protein
MIGRKQTFRVQKKELYVYTTEVERSNQPKVIPTSYVKKKLCRKNR